MNDKIPIDAVITWVDGNDPLHQRKMSLAVSSEKRKNNLSKYKEAGRYTIACSQLLSLHLL